MVIVACGLVPELTIEGQAAPKAILLSCKAGFKETAVFFAADRAVVWLPVMAITRTPSRAAAESSAWALYALLNSMMPSSNMTRTGTTIANSTEAAPRSGALDMKMPSARLVLLERETSGGGLAAAATSGAGAVLEGTG